MTPKTYKRETAALLLLFWCGMTTWGVWQENAREAAEFMATFVFLFAAGAFGLDAWSKQLGGSYRAS
tara:strand:+ start:1210 stop:1410 length:201 start_codon:yes stop_codon:yes gene_type:complete